MLATFVCIGVSVTAADYTTAPLRVAGESAMRFTLLPQSQTGVTFSNEVSRATRALAHAHPQRPRGG